VKFKFGDLVQVVNLPLEPHEPVVGLFWSDRIPIEEWGEQIAGECDCLVFWNEDIVPFNWEYLVLISEVGYESR